LHRAVIGGSNFLHFASHVLFANLLSTIGIDLLSDPSSLGVIFGHLLQ
jgi:hypothetical protein